MNKLHIRPSDEICNNCDPDYKNCWSRILIYPDLTKPSNFVKLLEILTSNELEVVFGTCKHKKTNFYCDIYHYETMTDTKGLVIDYLQELFCNISDITSKSLVSTLLKMLNGDLPIEMIDGELQENLYNMWEVSICIDYQEVNR